MSHILAYLAELSLLVIPIKYCRTESKTATHVDLNDPQCINCRCDQPELFCGNWKYVQSYPQQYYLYLTKISIFARQKSGIKETKTKLGLISSVAATYSPIFSKWNFSPDHCSSCFINYEQMIENSASKELSDLSVFIAKTTRST